MSGPGRPLPPALAEHARTYIDGTATPVAPKPAATVILLRTRSAGLEAYLLRRQQVMAFAGGMHVFPGGGVDPRDSDYEVPWAGPAPAQWAYWLGVDEGMARALVCAAVRETFEESGVLLAGQSAADVVADTTGRGWEADRLALIDRTVALSELLVRRGLVVRSDLLGRWARWITPEFEPKRYDTFFFVAALPEGQQTRDVGGEADRVLWVRPGDAAERGLSGELAMLPPTWTMLSEVSGYDAVSDVLAAASDRVLHVVMPKAVQYEDGEVRLLIPGEEGYPS